MKDWSEEDDRIAAAKHFNNRERFVEGFMLYAVDDKKPRIRPEVAMAHVAHDLTTDEVMGQDGQPTSVVRCVSCNKVISDDPNLKEGDQQ